MGFVQTVKEEIEVIRKTPLTFAITALIFAVAIYGVEHAIFKEQISSKDSLIVTLKDQLALAQAASGQKQTETPGSATPTTTTGPATANGPGGIANTGSGNRFDPGNSATPSGKK